MQYFAYSQKSFVYKYVVMLSDSDQFKHMSFANYLKLMFLSTDAMFMGCMTTNFLKEYRFQMIDSGMKFKRQSVVGDNILIKVNSSRVHESDFTLLYTYVLEERGDLVALGRQTFRFVCADSHGQVPITADMRKYIDQLAVDEENLIYKY